ncbi:MAG: hypothetical protein JWN25_16, partial [Verrucomicrobiales bacterium]|nr:hypothetical protein [Verrucomicrobiales bacterium]
LLFVFSFELGYSENLRRESEQMGAQILLVPKGCPYDSASLALYGAAWPCYLPSRYLKEVSSFPEVQAAAPVLMVSVASNNERQIIEGVEPLLLQFKKRWQIAGRFPMESNEIMAGSEVVADRGWKLGETVAVPGTQNTSATLVGILNKTLSADDRFLYLPLSWTQKLFHHPAEITHVMVKLRDPLGLDEATRKLRGCDAGMSMNVVPLAHLYHSISSILRSSRFLLYSIAAVSFLIAMGIVVANSSAVAFERMRDIGLMRALGASRSRIFSILVSFTLLLCIAGAVVGALLFTMCSPLLENWVKMNLSYPPTTTLIRWHWLLIAPAVLVPVLLGALSGIFPAWKGSRISPALLLQELQS